MAPFGMVRPSAPASPQARQAFLGEVQAAERRRDNSSRVAYRAQLDGSSRQEELLAVYHRRQKELTEGYFQRRLMWEEHDLCAGCGGPEFDWTKLCPTCKAKYHK